MTRFVLWGLYLCAILMTGRVPASAKTPPPASEMRGLWVVRTSILSPAAITNIVQTAKAHHVNALFVQVRGRGDAFYQSDLEPRAEELCHQPPEFDPLAEIIAQGHAAGLQIHAWLNTCFVWSAGRRPAAASHLVNQHPDWLARDAHGNFLLQAGPGCEGAFLSPANLDARQHIHDVFLDVARRYAVDGIHFDYVRYAGQNYDFSEAALARFREQMQGQARILLLNLCDARLRTDPLAYPHAFPREWQEFRRQQVSEMVESISHDIKAIKPSMVISAAVFADSKDAYQARGQDWKTWLARGYLDAVVPMAYGASTSLVAKQIQDAVHCARVSGRFAYAGVGSWHIPVGSTIAKIKAARTLGAQGAVLFSYGGITHDGQTTKYLDTLTIHCWPQKAVIPVMPWLAPQDSQQGAPTDIRPTAPGG